MERISKKGPGIIEAHLNHLKDHGEDKWFNQGVNWCKENGIEIDFNKISVEKPQNGMWLSGINGERLQDSSSFAVV